MVRRRQRRRVSEDPPIGEVSLLWFGVAFFVVAGFAAALPVFVREEMTTVPTSTSVGSYVLVPSIVVGIAAVAIDWEEEVDLYHVGNVGAAGAVAQGLVPGVLTLLAPYHRVQTWLLDVLADVVVSVTVAWATAYVCATYLPVEFDADLSSLRRRR